MRRWNEFKTFMFCGVVWHREVRRGKALHGQAWRGEARFW